MKERKNCEKESTLQSSSESLRSSLEKISRRNSLVRPERAPTRCDENRHFYSLQRRGSPDNESINHSIGTSENISYRSLDPYASSEFEKKSMRVGQSQNTNDEPKSIELKPHGNIFRKRTYSKDGNTQQFSIWGTYCLIITLLIPSFLLKWCGIRTRPQQVAWREKIGLISIICGVGTFVGYVSFLFSNTACSYYLPKINTNNITDNLVRIHGRAYPFNTEGIPESTPMLISYYGIFAPKSYGGSDATLLFQNVNGNCKELIKPKKNCSIPHDENGNIAWYFPCVRFFQNSTNASELINLHYSRSDCHISEFERESYYFLEYPIDISYSWEDIQTSKRKLVVYNGFVIDLDILELFIQNDLEIPLKLLELKTVPLKGYDISLIFTTIEDKRIARCLLDIAKVGVIESKSVECLVSHVILYLCLLFILSVVFFKFFTACYFRWCISRKQGANELDNRSMGKLMKTIEDWADDINSRAPIKDAEPNSNKSSVISEQFIKRNCERHLNGLPSWACIMPGISRLGSNTSTDQESFNSAHLSLHPNNFLSLRPPKTGPAMDTSISCKTKLLQEICKGHLDESIVHKNVLKQPDSSKLFQNHRLIHTLCFVTCYSEGRNEIRATLDAICTTDYPSTHKLVIIICDGLVTGKNSSRSTPEIVLDMIFDFVEDPNEVCPYTYLAIATGKRRRNMAKVYSGFYKYDSSTVPIEKQQKVPIVAIIKCGIPEEVLNSQSPGNRGKRDSQVILMSFLQKLTYNERMNELEYQILKNIWQVTGLMANVYETVLMVDADTRIYPNSITHMSAEMSRDNMIMGLCGETKIANKTESWVTMIQVFEYYIAHHQSKAFESVFGSVLCLPGCFSMYRIKVLRDGEKNSWVPILANPDIVERYSNNITITLHSKNLLLLGEDRYLSSLLLRTFPSRKQVFLPKAACKTVVPSSFTVLLSQRRRWINSTVHNLLDLLKYNYLCGTFCFSMQFVVILELLGTVLLPFAIVATVYVIIYSIVSNPTPLLTLILLLIILGLPGIFIVVTTTKWIYIVWMIVYLLALPIWNLILPTYAFWKFDDFSWGDTRVTKEKSSKDNNNDQQVFGSTPILLLSWRDHAIREIDGDRQSKRKKRL